MGNPISHTQTNDNKSNKQSKKSFRFWIFVLEMIGLYYCKQQSQDFNIHKAEYNTHL